MSEDAPRLYLITPPLTDAAPVARIIEATLRSADVACVHLRAAPGADSVAIAKVLLPIVQQSGAACLLSDLTIAAALGADGAHIDTPGVALEAALKAMKPKYIVGVGGLVTRDDAMRAGESGADYLMFGGPEDRLTAPQIGERIAWWAEIFNVPCVAYAPALADIADMIAAGADFVALEAAVWGDPRGAAAAIKEVKDLMASGGAA
jgi:thiamine-phosphate pyrophosphorylase